MSGALLFFDGINGKNELGISFMTWDIPYNYMVIWLHRYIVIIYIYIHTYIPDFELPSLAGRSCVIV